MTAPAGRGTGEAELPSNSRQIGLHQPGTVPYKSVLAFLWLPTVQKPLRKSPLPSQRMKL